MRGIDRKKRDALLELYMQLYSLFLEKEVSFLSLDTNLVSLDLFKTDKVSIEKGGKKIRVVPRLSFPHL